MIYEQFIQDKFFRHKPSGFECDNFNSNLMDWQKECVRWSLFKGKSALFEGTGLGKTIQSLEWSDQIHRHTKKPVMIIAPLAVSKQTKREGEKFGYDVNICKDETDVKNMINITNYEKIHKFNTSVFHGVVLDECFPPETPIDVFNIDNSLTTKYIKDIRRNDVIFNATGEDNVKEIYKRKINRAVQISYNGRNITCSENHPFFTMYGWKLAQDLLPGDNIMATGAAVRMVRGDIQTEICSEQVQSVLRDILLSEMENEYPGTQGKGTQQGSGREARKIKVEMVQIGLSCCLKRNREDEELEPNGGPVYQDEGVGYASDDEAQTFSAWGEWSPDDISAANNEGCIIRGLESGISHIIGETSTRFSYMLQSRLRKYRSENSNRNRWPFPQEQDGIRQEKRHEAHFFRVESVEILEQGHPELEKYRDASGDIYFYDIKAERHPSFSVNGGLVHNSGILKNFSGKTRNSLIESFSRTPYKLCASATPSPNDYTELGGTSHFLNVMTRSEMLSMYFINDTKDTGNWRLKGHVEKNIFWEFISSWALMFQSPYDIGFDGSLFELPELIYKDHVVKYKGKYDGLFCEPAKTLIERNRARNESLVDRCELAAELINKSDKNHIVWCNLNSESDLLKKIIKDSVEVRGSDSENHKESAMIDFQDNKIKCLITKPSIAGHGMNWQNCHNMSFVGLSDSFEEMYQAVRRCWRFGQKEKVTVNVITGEREGLVVDNIKRKEKDMENMLKGMVSHMKTIMQKELKQTSKNETFYEPSVEMKIPSFLRSEN